MADDFKAYFEKMSWRNAMEAGFRDDDWKAVKDINQRHEASRRETERVYRLEYAMRVEAARKMLIDEAGSKPRDFVPRWLGGRDRFNAGVIERQAHRVVRAEHHRDLVRIDRQEDRELDAVYQSVDRRREAAAEARDSFERATDRRMTQDRRVTPERRRQTGPQ